MKSLPLAACLALVTGCSAAPQVENDSFVANVEDLPPEPAPARDYTGRWTGVEGTYLQVSAGGSPGRYRLEMQYDLDNKATVEGRLEGDAIVFRRAGKTLRLRPTDGGTTGLKYLDGKRDCLTVQPGEGYCRG